MDNNLESFKNFLKQRENAARAYVCGDPVPVASITTGNPLATFFAPNGSISQGAEDVLNSFNQGAGMFEPGGNTHFEILQMAASESIAYWVGLQRASVHMHGNKDAIPMNLRVTEIFRREKNEWKLIHRHAEKIQ